MQEAFIRETGLLLNFSQEKDLFDLYNRVNENTEDIDNLSDGLNGINSDISELFIRVNENTEDITKNTEDITQNSLITFLIV